MHQFEPELRGPTPRPIRKKPTGINLWVRGLCAILFPHTVVGIGVLLFAFSTLMLPFGPLLDGHVKALRVFKGSKGRSVYRTTIAYGNDQVDKSITPAFYKKLQNSGARVQIRLHPMHLYSVLVVDGVPENNPVTIWFFALLWNCFVVVYVWSIWGCFIMERHLVRTGIPTSARITNKSEQRRNRIISYEFTPRGRFIRKSTQQCSAADYLTTEVGTEQTVLYSDKFPFLNVLYRHANWEAEPRPLGFPL